MYVKLCPRGCHVVSASYDGVVTAWKLNESAPTPPQVDAVFSSDGRRAVWLTNGTATVQDLETSKALGIVESGSPPAMRPMCSDDGSTLLLRTSESDVNRGRIWNIARAQYEGVPFAVAASLTNHVLSGDGRFLAAYTADELEAID